MRRDGGRERREADGGEGREWRQKILARSAKGGGILMTFHSDKHKNSRRGGVGCFY